HDANTGSTLGKVDTFRNSVEYVWFAPDEELLYVISKSKQSDETQVQLWRWKEDLQLASSGIPKVIGVTSPSDSKLQIVCGSRYDSEAGFKLIQPRHENGKLELTERKLNDSGAAN